MKKINILKSNREYERIISTQKPFKTKYFLIFKEKSDNPIYKFGFSVGKKTGNAVHRNKTKRRLKNIVDKKHYKNNFNCIIMVKKTILNCSFEDMDEELIRSLKTLGLIEE